RVRNAGKIVTSAHGRRTRAPEVLEFDARRQPKRVALRRDVEIEILEAPLILRGIHAAHRGVDADQLEVLDIGADNALERRIEKQELDRELFSFGVLESL